MLALLTREPDVRGDLTRRIAEELVRDDALVVTLARDAGQTILSTSLRGKLTAALATVMSARLEDFAAQNAQLRRLGKELAQPWRIEQGGVEGEPTDTRVLIGMAAEAHAEVRGAEDLILRSVKLAIDEAKGSDVLSGGSGLEGRYTGRSEVAPIPTDLTPAERETMRNLAAMLKKGIEARRELATQGGPAIPVSATVLPAVPGPGAAPISPAARPLDAQSAASPSQPESAYDRGASGAPPEANTF